METISLQNIIGHPHIIEFLQNSIRFGQIGHAYLFYGPDGIGKETATRRFSMTLLCQQPTQEYDACGECDSCQRFNRDAHPNFQLLEPEGQFNYKVEQLRDLRKNVSFTAYQGDRRVYLIPDADKMQPEGANAILKTLEEPSPGVIFVLVSSNILRILPTIVSRCQQVRFGRLSTQLLEETLIKKWEVSPENAKWVSSLADGSLGKAKELSNPAVSDFRKEIFASLAKQTPGDLKNSFELPKKMIELRKQLDTNEDIKIDTVTLYDWLLFWFRDILVYRITKDESNIINLDFKKEISAISSKWSWTAIRSAFQQLEYLKSIATKNIGAQFTLETVFLRAYQSVS